LKSSHGPFTRPTRIPGANLRTYDLNRIKKAGHRPAFSFWTTSHADDDPGQHGRLDKKLLALPAIPHQQ
jgi:hypothetical protein